MINDLLAIGVVVAGLALLLFVIGPLLVWLVGPHSPQLHWWEHNKTSNRDSERAE